jgi:glutamine synthetase
LIAAADALDSAMGVHDFATTEEHMHYCADTLETLVACRYRPLPKYREVLFIE